MLALLVSAAASIAGMYMVLTADLGVRRNRYLTRAADAARIGLSGLQLARARLGADGTWTGGTVVDPQTSTDSVTITATMLRPCVAHVEAVGAAGDATQSVRADLRAVQHPALDFRVVSATTVTFDECTIGGSIRANGDVLANGDVDFYGALETTQTSTVAHEIPAGQVTKVANTIVPPVASIATYSAAASSLIGVPLAGAAYLLEDVALRPDANPYGATNANGAYVFDAGGADVILRDVYVEGTLIFENVGTVTIEEGFHLVRANQSFASLLVDGDLEVRLETALAEYLSLVDFNGDGDVLDLYTPEIEGVIYATGAFVGPYAGQVKGSILANEVTLTGVATLKSSSIIAAQPVVEFTLAGPWDIVPGTIDEGL